MNQKPNDGSIPPLTADFSAALSAQRTALLSESARGFPVDGEARTGSKSTPENRVNTPTPERMPLLAKKDTPSFGSSLPSETLNPLRENSEKSTLANDAVAPKRSFFLWVMVAIGWIFTVFAFVWGRFKLPWVVSDIPDALKTTLSWGDSLLIVAALLGPLLVLILMAALSGQSQKLKFESQKMSSLVEKVSIREASLGKAPDITPKEFAASTTPIRQEIERASEAVANLYQQIRTIESALAVHGLSVEKLKTQTQDSIESIKAERESLRSLVNALEEDSAKAIAIGPKIKDHEHDIKQIQATLALVQEQSVTIQKTVDRMGAEFSHIASSMRSNLRTIKNIDDADDHDQLEALAQGAHASIKNTTRNGVSTLNTAEVALRARLADFESKILAQEQASAPTREQAPSVNTVNHAAHSQTDSRESIRDSRYAVEQSFQRASGSFGQSLPTLNVLKKQGSGDAGSHFASPMHDQKPSEKAPSLLLSDFDISSEGVITAPENQGSYKQSSDSLKSYERKISSPARPQKPLRPNMGPEPWINASSPSVLSTKTTQNLSSATKASENLISSVAIPYPANAPSAPALSISGSISGPSNQEIPKKNTTPTYKRTSLDWKKFIKASDFSSNENQETLDAFYDVLTDPQAAAFSQVAGDVLEHFEALGIFVEHYQPALAPFEHWHTYFTQGHPDLKDLMTMDDDVLKRVTDFIAGDSGFENLALRFSGRYEAMLCRLYMETEDDALVFSFVNSRSGRNFALISGAKARLQRS